jgi:hypothetical protein
VTTRSKVAASTEERGRSSKQRGKEERQAEARDPEATDARLRGCSLRILATWFPATAAMTIPIQNMSAAPLGAVVRQKAIAATPAHRRASSPVTPISRSSRPQYTTYSGRPFNLSARSPLRDGHRSASN